MGEANGRDIRAASLPKLRPRGIPSIAENCTSGRIPLSDPDFPKNMAPIWHQKGQPKRQWPLSN